jgi:hypothetical protein
MPRLAALRVALLLANRPIELRHTRCSPLPEDVTQLLKVAVADVEGLQEAQALTGRSQAALQKAAAFFIEQIMLHDDADSYRVLGVGPTAGRRELRLNMTLLIRWLHPDNGELHSIGSQRQRDILMHRVTQAWDNLKTDERRAAYDRSLREEKRKKPFAKSYKQASAGVVRAQRKQSRSRAQVQCRAASRRLVVHRFERASLWSRLMSYLWMRI